MTVIEENFVVSFAREFLAKRYTIEEFSRRAIENLAAYEETEEKRKKYLVARGNEPDEDGFITVVNKKPKVVFEAPNSLSNQPNNHNDNDDLTEEADSVSKEKEARPTKTLPNFYKVVGRAQEWERKKQLEDLRKKFQEDRKKLNELKRSKLFNSVPNK